MSKQEMELALEAICALGVIGDGYCFCSKDRDPDKRMHEPECRDVLSAIAALKEAIKQHDAEPVAWRAWDDGLSRWDFTLWPDEQCNEGRDWEPLYLSAPSIPDGWQLVPKEPTQGMCDAGRREARDWETNMRLNDGAAMGFFKIYKAMLAASPQPTKGDA